jgi:GntR family transcriptional regulator, transcriptional repressor for pyruvate dehydrogenase complex
MKTKARNRNELLAIMEHAILSGEVPVGSKLPSENTLCRQHGISRGSVREVMEALKSRGLAEGRRGSGTFVTTGDGQDALRQSVSTFSALRVSGRDFRELMDLRLLLECSCVEALATPEAAAGRRALRHCLHAMERCSNDLAAFAAADIRFHREIVVRSKHRLFTSILEGLYDGVALRFARATYTDASLTAKTLADHTAICEALEMGSADQANASLKKHLLDSLNHLEELRFSSECRTPGSNSSLFRLV